MYEKYIESPCVNTCKIDRNTSFCIGCYRTLQEIAAWSRLAESEKVAILKGVKLRKTRQLLT